MPNDPWVGYKMQRVKQMGVREHATVDKCIALFSHSTNVVAIEIVQKPLRVICCIFFVNVWTIKILQ